MRRSLPILLLACAAVMAACAESDTSPSLASPVAAPTTQPAATSATTTTVAPATTIVDSAPSTTAAPSTTTTSLVPLDQLELTLEEVARGFDAPVFATSPPDDPRLFVVDQPGVIWVIDDGDPEVFLDIRERVIYGGERGLLGLAFDPAFDQTGRFYVNYTGSGSDTVVSEYVASGNTADPSSERIVLGVDQPASNHNGGMIAFGPDGYLWIGMGDGGGSNDRYGNSQDAQTLLGSLLRIDPTTDPYGIPEDNPGRSDDAFADEAWAIGLRNPWRFSFDGRELWIADVGQNAWEEIDRVDIDDGGGVNFGWPQFEGTNCYRSSTCDDSEFTAPIHEYSHGDGCSITGGYVYRGTAIPELAGHYFFGDHCLGWIRSLSPAGDAIDWFDVGTITELSSFGVDTAGDVYVMGFGGTVFRLARDPG